MFLALGVIYTGMSGTTKREFTQRFNQEYYNMDNFMLKANTSDLVWSELVKSIEREDITFLTVMLSKIPLENNFISQISKRYGAETVMYNSGDTSGAIKKLNKKINTITGGKVKGIGDGIFKPDTVAAVASLLYFKRKWEHKFYERKTEKFYTQEGKYKELPFMYVKYIFDYIESDEFVLVSFPYKDSKFRLVALLPNEQLSSDQLLQLMANMTATKIEAKMPQFEIKSKLDLRDLLKKFGLTTMFHSLKADFSKMCKEPVFIGEGEQLAAISVDHKGTEAYALTILNIQSQSGPTIIRNPIKITLNRPFAFFIAYDNIILFMGKMRG